MNLERNSKQVCGWKIKQNNSNKIFKFRSTAQSRYYSRSCRSSPIIFFPFQGLLFLLVKVHLSKSKGIDRDRKEVTQVSTYKEL